MNFNDGYFFQSMVDYAVDTLNYWIKTAEESGYKPDMTKFNELAEKTNKT